VVYNDFENKDDIMKKNLVSVIIPVYNVEKYLDKCIDSVVCQTYKNLEIILVDDGSPDNCPKMCDDWAKKDKRIKVIHKKNGGQGSARNMALEIITGDYVCFIDSDDWLELDYVEVMLEACINNNADIAICKIKSIDEEKPIPNDVVACKNLEIFEGDNLVYEAYNNQKLFSHQPSNKLYKRTIFSNLRYPEIRMCEDSAIYLNTFFFAKKVVFIPIYLYNYLIRTGSTMRRPVTIERFDSILKHFEMRIDFLFKNKIELLKYFEIVSCLGSLIGLYIRAKDKNLKHYIIGCYNCYKEKYKDVVNFKNAPLKLKLKMIFIKIF